MGRRSGITKGGYDPRIFKMRTVMVQREWNREQEQRMINKKRVRAAYWAQRLSNAMCELKHADAQGWERWYDDDNNVPAEATNRDIARLVEARVIELIGTFPHYKARICRDIFIWQDRIGFFVYSKEVGKDALYVIEFETFDAAAAFIKGLPYGNCGYGVVLDLLPAKALAMIEKEA